MADVVVTLPKSFGWHRWIAEGDAAGDPWTGRLYRFTVRGPRPFIKPGERVYVVYDGQLRGYAPLVQLEWDGNRGGAFIRGGGAVALTVDEHIPGFRGWRYSWWRRGAEYLVPIAKKPINERQMPFAMFT